MRNWKRKKKTKPMGFQPLTQQVPLLGPPAATAEPQKYKYPFTCDLITENLWQGDWPDTAAGTVWDRFDDVVSMTAEGVPDVTLRTGGLWLYVPIWDSLDRVYNPGGIRAAAQLVATRVGEGKRVLVHCAAGLNRSGIVTARALMFMGHDVREAIEIVRTHRKGALFNPKFVEWLYQEANQPMPAIEWRNYAQELLVASDDADWSSDNEEVETLWAAILKALDEEKAKTAAEQSERSAPGSAVEVPAA